jgi:hypothetical protein
MKKTPSNGTNTNICRAVVYVIFVVVKFFMNKYDEVHVNEDDVGWASFSSFEVFVVRLPVGV